MGYFICRRNILLFRFLCAYLSRNMERYALKNLVAWENSPNGMPLIISGARQVGKTFILKKFGETEFNEFHYFNFESDKKLSGIFDVDLNPLRIISELSVIRKINPLDLIIFDEIQACLSALTALKYFSEALPNQAIVCAGSLLGIELSDKPFPVGKVNHLNLYPLSFKEFLGGIGDGAALEQLSRIHSELIVSDFIHEHLSKRFRSY